MNCYLLAPTANGPLDPLEVRRPAGATPTGQDCFAISMEHTLRKRKIFAELFGCTHDFEAANPGYATLNPLPMGADGPPRLAAHPHSGLQVPDSKFAAWLDLLRATGDIFVEREPPLQPTALRARAARAGELSSFAASRGGTGFRGTRLSAGRPRTSTAAGVDSNNAQGLDRAVHPP